MTITENTEKNAFRSSDPEKHTSSRNPIQVADRLFGALELLADQGDMGLFEISNKLGLNKSTTHRILASLEYLGYVHQVTDGRYELTFRIVEEANKLIDHTDISGKVRPCLRRLMEETGETVHLVRQDGAYAVYIDKVESHRNAIQMVSRIGSRIPLYCSGVGKAILASLPDEEVRFLWSQSRIQPVTPKTITSYSALMQVLGEVRKSGYAVDNEENEEGVRCIAAALNFPIKNEKYAFSISAPANRMDETRIRELSRMVLREKAEMEREFTGK